MQYKYYLFSPLTQIAKKKKKYKIKKNTRDNKIICEIKMIIVFLLNIIIMIIIILFFVYSCTEIRKSNGGETYYFGI